MQSLNINNSKTTHFFAVCDGHGSLGHHVSGFVKQFLPLILLSDTNVIYYNIIFFLCIYINLIIVSF